MQLGATARQIWLHFWGDTCILRHDERHLLHPHSYAETRRSTDCATRRDRKYLNSDCALTTCCSGWSPTVQVRGPLACVSSSSAAEYTWSESTYTVDSGVSSSTQITLVVRAALRQICSVRRSLTGEALLTLIRALVVTKLLLLGPGRRLCNTATTTAIRPQRHCATSILNQEIGARDVTHPRPSLVKDTGAYPVSPLCLVHRCLHGCTQRYPVETLIWNTAQNLPVARDLRRRWKWLLRRQIAATRGTGHSRLPQRRHAFRQSSGLSDISTSSKEKVFTVSHSREWLLYKNARSPSCNNLLWQCHSNHRRTVVPPCLNGDIAIQWAWSNFDTSQKPSHLTDYDKTLHNWLRPRDEHVGLTQKLCQSAVTERLAKYVKYKASSFLFLFPGLAYWSNLCMEFHARCLKTSVVT